MPSEAQVVANRRNAEKSTGPRTPEGKAVVAQNAVKHGLLARQDLITGEDQQAFDLCREKLLAELIPAGTMQSILAERIVSLTWRLKRAQRLQNEVFDYLLAAELKDSLKGFFDELLPEDKARLLSNPATDPHLAVGRAVERDYRHERVLDRLMMYERRIENSLYRTMSELKKLRLMRDEGDRSVRRVPATGGSGKAEGVADGGWANQRQAALAAATENSTEFDASNSFDGADSMKPDHPKPHGQTSLPVPPGDCAKQSQSPAREEPHGQPVATQRVASPGGVATNEANRAKQSQLPRPAASVRTVLRARPRVACHSHNVARSY